MRQYLAIQCLIIIIFLGCKTSSHVISGNAIQKKDLSQLAWIEGNWRGMAGSEPFHEIYQQTNDSTFLITSYDWNGKDSSNTSRAYLTWNKNHYYLGDSLNWRVDSIWRDAIFMSPNYRAANTILWRKKDAQRWEAILTSPRGTRTYLMERVNHFNSNKR